MDGIYFWFGKNDDHDATVHQTYSYPAGFTLLFSTVYADQHWRFKNLGGVGKIQAMLFDIDFAFAPVPDESHKQSIALIFPEINDVSA